MNLSFQKINPMVFIVSIGVLATYLLLEYFQIQFHDTLTFSSFGLVPFFGLGSGSSNSGSASGPAANTKGTANYTGSQGMQCSGCSQAEFSAAGVESGATVTNKDGYSTATYSDGSKSTWSGNTGSGSNSSSTPFLKIWNGKEFVFENDFLFGKPQTAFATYAEGFKAYMDGIGGDTYILRTAPAIEAGTLRLQVREIEPEESFIDSFAIHAVDIAPHESLVVDGNLKDVHVFDTNTSSSLREQSIRHYHKKQNVFTEVAFDTSNIFSTHDIDGIMLEKGDELIMTVPRASLGADTPIFIMVDSHFRDWTLGEQIPFSALDRFAISSFALGRSIATTAFGVSLILGATFVTSGVPSVLKEVVHAPYAHADTPHCTSGCSYIGSGGKSLKVSVLVDGVRIHLETLFPRFVRASKEVVRIPSEILSRLDSEFVTVCIEATKRHKVTFASLVSGNVRPLQSQALPEMQVVNASSKEDVSATLSVHNGTFVHTTPGDVYDVTIRNVPESPVGMERFYMLHAHGFYTKLSDRLKKELGQTWYTKLASEDRTLLRQLKQFNV